jgi:LytR cell envelope-related transcriptional attenuator
MIRRLVAVVAPLCALALLGAVALARQGEPSPMQRAREQSKVRIKVQVLNATTTRGLGRRAMLHLRDHGFDVVELGTTTATRDSTLVLDRSHHPEWAQRVARSLGGARVESRPDTSRYLDVTVLLGGNWRAPSQTFHP